MNGTLLGTAWIGAGAYALHDAAKAYNASDDFTAYAARVSVPGADELCLYWYSGGQAPGDGLIIGDTLTRQFSRWGSAVTAGSQADDTVRASKSTPEGRAAIAAVGCHANDGDVAGSDQIMTTGPAGEVTLAVQVAESSDDAEEDTTGRTDFSSGDLEMVQEDTDQIVGLRFVGVEVPSGATITGAHLQFRADETNNIATTLLLHGQARDNPAPFANSDFNVSSRARTTASRSWSPPAWNSRGESGAAQRTDDISGLIQEIVDRGGWSSSNAIVIIITGTGKRVAESYDGNRAGAPILTISYIP